MQRVRRPRAALAYHGVGIVSEEQDPATLVVSPTNLAAQVDALISRGYRFLTASEAAAEGGDPGPGTAVLTFDDGWESGLTEVVPLLAARGLRATFYVCPGWLGGQHPDVAGPAGRLADADAVRGLQAAGMEVGSHTMTHPDLRTLDDAELHEQIVTSRARLEELLQAPCPTFAYPFGLYDERVVAKVREAGHTIAWAWLPGPWVPLEAPRLPAPCRHGSGRLMLKLRGVRRVWTR